MSLHSKKNTIKLKLTYLCFFSFCWAFFYLLIKIRITKLLLYYIALVSVIIIFIILVYSHTQASKVLLRAHT